MKPVQRIMIEDQQLMFGKNRFGDNRAQTAKPKQPQNSRDQMFDEKANGA